MAKSKRKFSEDFKREAVNLLLASGKSVTAISTELGIEPYNLSRWKGEFLMDENKPQAQAETPAEKLRRLEKLTESQAKETNTLKQERDILKKSLGIVSKQ
jgi:transposase